MGVMRPASGQYHNQRMAEWPDPRDTAAAIRHLTAAFPHHVRPMPRVVIDRETPRAHFGPVRNLTRLISPYRAEDPNVTYREISDWLTEQIGPTALYLAQAYEPLDKTHWTDGRWCYVGYKEFPLAFCFENEDEAFAFKMRWG